MEGLGAQIKYLRVKKGITQEELAIAIGATKSSISNYESGRRKPSNEAIHAIAKVLEVPKEEFSDYMYAKEINGKKNWVDVKRPRRVKKLLDAFYRLSDEAQIKAIERVEELALIPMYQRKLADVLQRYISNLYNLTYKLEEDILLSLTYDGNSGDTQWPWDVEHIVLQHGTNTSVQEQWNFFYCSCTCDIITARDAGIKPIMEYIRYQNEPDYNLSFVFDDESALDEFLDSYKDEKYQPESDFDTVRYETPLMFLLVEKGTWEILDVQKYIPDNEF